MSEKFTSSSKAFFNARQRASVAAALEADTLHIAIFDAREAGMSIPDAAAALRLPKRTVARHWREGHRCADVIPVWGSPESWREAHRAIWAHDPSEHLEEFVPYQWHESPNGRVISHRYRGVAEIGY